MHYQHARLVRELQVRHPSTEEADGDAEDALREAFKLSEVELKRAYDFGQGHGLLMTPEGHVPFYNLLSDREKGLFTTSPKEMKV